VRLVILLACAVAFAPLSMVAAQSVAVAPLAPEEMLLEVDATGAVSSPADLVTVVIPVSASKATAAEARRAAVQQAEKVASAVRAAGVPAADVSITEPSRRSMFGFEGSEEVMQAMSAQEGQSAATPRTDLRTVRVRLRDPAAFEKIRDAAEAAGAATVPAPSLALADEAPARAEAKSRAVQKARAEADSYARSLGMRVARILRVSERTSPNPGNPQQWALLVRMMTGGGETSQGRVETQITLSVDFALAPAR
jgi:hypothetical protein